MEALGHSCRIALCRRRALKVPPAHWYLSKGDTVKAEEHTPGSASTQGKILIFRYRTQKRGHRTTFRVHSCLEHGTISDLLHEQLNCLKVMLVQQIIEAIWTSGLWVPQILSQISPKWTGTSNSQRI